jgi:hypothetical protein
MRTVLALTLLLICGAAYGQNFMLKGEILDENAKPLSSVAAVLLNPSDSTLLYFSVTGSNGRFQMGNIKKGDYILQVSLLGYKTINKVIAIPLSTGEDIGSLIMNPRVFAMNEVTVSGERIPIRILSDTIEYNAKAFKVKPDGVAEDLLTKMPGIEVDRAGNIKAMGEDVKNVLVDGKEFFGGDPKVTTRNLPAEAIDKVQLFDKQSDESSFTGIDDGERNPTLNFVLDENKKKGIFGDVLGGYGTNNRAEASGKVYRFTKKSQLAALGMYNNINQFGFSFGDYINFSGGISSFSSGGHMVLGSGNSFPVNFGQPVYGLGSNGAAGINFSVFNENNDRFFVSYLGNGSKRKLSEQSVTKNYIPDGTFLANEARDENKSDTTHRLNFGLRKKFGQRQNIIVNGGLSYNSSSDPLNSTYESFLNDTKVNEMNRNSSEITSRLSGSADASYLYKIKEGKTIFRLSARGEYSGGNSDIRFNNTTTYSNPFFTDITNQFYNIHSETGGGSGSISLTTRISRRSYIDISLGSGYSSENINREQGNIDPGMLKTDSLSPTFKKAERYLKPGIAWKLSSQKSQFTVGLTSNIGEFGTTLNNGEQDLKSWFFINPRASWEYDYRTGRRLMIDYSTTFNTPQASQLLPVVNNINSLSLFYGNRNLKPENIQSGRLMWWLFDQFSFTMLLTSINFSYTTDKIGYSRTVNENLGQEISLINVKDDWVAGGNIDFSTPFKSLGLMINLSLNENYNRGISYVNGTENINTSYNHNLSLTISNRKKEKWDIETGSTVSATDSRYSVQNSLNNVYYDLSWFATLGYTAGKRFHLGTSADITSYLAKSFDKKQVVPLIGAEASFYFLKNQRGVLTLSGVDLLNRNTGIERTSELNYLVERKSSIIGRYIMLSFKYRLNKIGDSNGGIDIKVKSR